MVGNSNEISGSEATPYRNIVERGSSLSAVLVIAGGDLARVTMKNENQSWPCQNVYCANMTAIK
jgi:hypothetical protein